MRVRRPPIAFVPDCERFIYEHPSACERPQQLGEEWTVQIVGDDHGGVNARFVGPAAVFDIGAQRMYARHIRQAGDGGSIAVNGIHRVSSRGKPACMAPATARDVENATTALNE